MDLARSSLARGEGAIVNCRFIGFNKQLHRSNVNNCIGQLRFLLVGWTAAEASSASDLLNQISPMLPPKIAEVKYTLIGLQDVCGGQASGDWLLRDKQVSGFRKYGPDKSLESPLDYSMQKSIGSQQNIYPAVFCMLLVSTGADLGRRC